MQWETVIGLEVHAQLLTHSKIFSGASTRYGALPNTQACAIDLGFPGVLPVLNQAVILMAVKFGLSIQANIAKRSVFNRKNYFYPDLPKGYQISQYELPIVQHGYLEIPLETGGVKRINIERAHLEEDAGKSLHEDFHGMTGVDLNRAGVPLLEIVSQPDMRSAEEAIAYLKMLHALVCYLEICDGNLQEGSFRCDANVSVRPLGETKFGTRVEIKNLNSFKFIEKAILHERDRQIVAIESGQSVMQETRLYDPDLNQTRPMRSKEEANDYRYFPDPDLLPVVLTDELIEQVKKDLPELPTEKQARFLREYGLTDYDIKVLTSTKALADYFEAVASVGVSPKLAVNWVMGELSAFMNQFGVDIANSPITAQQLGLLLKRIEDGTISGKIAKTVFQTLWETQGDVDAIIESSGLKQLSDVGALEKIVDKIIADHPAQVADFRSGKEKLFGFFVGQIMKASQGKANPDSVNELLRKKL